MNKEKENLFCSVMYIWDPCWQSERLPECANWLHHVCACVLVKVCASVFAQEWWSRVHVRHLWTRESLSAEPQNTSAISKMVISTYNVFSSLWSKLLWGCELNRFTKQYFLCSQNSLFQGEAKYPGSISFDKHICVSFQPWFQRQQEIASHIYFLWKSHSCLQQSIMQNTAYCLSLLIHPLRSQWAIYDIQNTTNE